MRSSRRVRRSKRRVAISKRIVGQVQKKCNEVQKKRFPIYIYIIIHNSLFFDFGLAWAIINRENDDEPLDFRAIPFSDRPSCKKSARSVVL